MWVVFPWRSGFGSCRGDGFRQISASKERVMYASGDSQLGVGPMASVKVCLAYPEHIKFTTLATHVYFVQYATQCS